MREIPREPDTGRFLLKAINEAGRELVEELYAIRPREADRRTPDGWSYRLIAAHVRDHEEMMLTYLERILSSRREPRLDAIDAERVLDDPDALTEHLERILDEFGYLRRQTGMLLWDLSPAAWERRGLHVYRGPLTVLQLARELNQHDLEHLWQVRNLRAAGLGARR